MKLISRAMIFIRISSAKLKLRHLSSASRFPYAWWGLPVHGLWSSPSKIGWCYPRTSHQASLISYIHLYSTIEWLKPPIQSQKNHRPTGGYETLPAQGPPMLAGVVRDAALLWRWPRNTSPGQRRRVRRGAKLPEPYASRITSFNKHSPNIKE